MRFLKFLPLVGAPALLLVATACGNSYAPRNPGKDITNTPYVRQLTLHDDTTNKNVSNGDTIGANDTITAKWVVENADYVEIDGSCNSADAVHYNKSGDNQTLKLPAPDAQNNINLSVVACQTNGTKSDAHNVQLHVASATPSTTPTVTPTTIVTATPTASPTASPTPSQTNTPVTLTITASPTTVTQGQPDKVTWATTGADKVLLDGKQVAASDSVTETLSSTTTHTLVVIEGSVSQTSSVTVTVMPKSVTTPQPVPSPSPTPAQTVAPQQSSGNQAGGTAPGADYGIYPQMQIGHPSKYIETGVPNTDDLLNGQQDNGHTQKWQLVALPGTTVIVGGYTVDGVSGGVYEAFEGPITQADQKFVTVTDGFMSIIIDQWSQNEFCFRIGQAVKFHWAHATEKPLPSWPSCTNGSSTSAPSTQAQPQAQTTTVQASCQLTYTGKGTQVALVPGCGAGGYSVTINGQTDNNCWLDTTSTTSSGTVTDGWTGGPPSASDTAALHKCNITNP